MFGVMSIKKAERFFRSHHLWVKYAIDLNPESGINYLAYKWSHYETIIVSDFKKKYRITLSIEQRWHIFLELMKELPFPLDNSLGDFLMSGIISVGDWSLGARADLSLKQEFDVNDETLVLNGFPKLSLFMYSLENYEIVYEGDEYAEDFVRNFSALGNVTTRNELRSWYQFFWDLREKVINVEQYPAYS